MAGTNHLRPALGHLPLDMIDRASMAKLREGLARLKKGGVDVWRPVDGEEPIDEGPEFCFPNQ